MLRRASLPAWPRPSCPCRMKNALNAIALCLLLAKQCGATIDTPPHHAPHSHRGPESVSSFPFAHRPTSIQPQPPNAFKKSLDSNRLRRHFDTRRSRKAVHYLWRWLRPGSVEAEWALLSAAPLIRASGRAARCQTRQRPLRRLVPPRRGGRPGGLPLLGPRRRRESRARDRRTLAA